MVFKLPTKVDANAPTIGGGMHGMDKDDGHVQTIIKITNINNINDIMFTSFCFIGHLHIENATYDHFLCKNTTNQMGWVVNFPIHSKKLMPHYLNPNWHVTFANWLFCAW